MKKKIILIIIIALSLILSSCKKETYEFRGEIIELNNSNAIVLIDEGEEIRNSGDKVEVDLSVNTDVEFSIGDRIKVEYDGMVQEKYPLGITTISVELIND